MVSLSTPRARLAIVGLAAVGVVGVLGVSGLDDNLVYYRTPTELATEQGQSSRVRLGGLVQQGSVRDEGGTLRFVLTDGAQDVAVVYEGETTGVFREGQGAVVEGLLEADGTFVADTLLVKHSNEYKDGSGTTYEPRAG